MGALGNQQSVRAELTDAAGRKAMDLRPGANDVSRLAPGVYFITGSGARNTARARKIVIQR